jgi:6-phosphogluconolactonase (cycloisomerase 2 family)
MQFCDSLEDIFEQSSSPKKISDFAPVSHILVSYFSNVAKQKYRNNNNNNNNNNTMKFTAALPLMLASFLAIVACADAEDHVVGAIFTSTNTYGPYTAGAPSAGSGPFFDGPRLNQLAMYHKMGDGSLKGPIGYYNTVDQGTIPTTAQDTVIVDGDLVFTAAQVYDPDNVNDVLVGGYVAVFAFNKYGALRTDVKHSGNENVQATSLALGKDGKILYVLHNAYETGNVQPMMIDFGAIVKITAFAVESNATLTPLPDLTRELNIPSLEFPGPNTFLGFHIKFTEDFKYLMACNGNPFNSDVRAYKVNEEDGMLAETPLISFGNSQGASSMVVDNFGGKNYIYVGAGVTGEVAAYVINEEEEELKFINKVVSSGPGTALCWLAQYGDYLYSANAAGQSISTYLIQRDASISPSVNGILDDAGRVELVEAVAANITADTGGQGALPFDFYVDGRYLYVLLAGSGSIATYIIEGEGESLTYDSMIGGLASSINDAFLNVGQGLAGTNFQPDPTNDPSSAPTRIPSSAPVACSSAPSVSSAPSSSAPIGTSRPSSVQVFVSLLVGFAAMIMAL